MHMHIRGISLLCRGKSTLSRHLVMRV